MEEYLTGSDLITLFIIFVCIIFAALFSCTETAVTSLDPLKVKHIMASRGKKALSLKLWAEHPERVLVTILIYNNVVNILATSLATSLATVYFKSSGVGIATGLMTILIIVFAEIIPKSFGKTHAEPVAIITMKMIALLYKISSPLIKIFSGLAKLVVRAFSKKVSDDHEVTEEQLEFMLNESHRAGKIKDEKRDIIEGAFDFDETKVKEIITPRTSLKCLDENATFKEAIDLSISTGFSRLPVYRQNLDQIIGIVLIKDVLAASANNPDYGSLFVKNHMRETFFAPESKTIMRLFFDLKKTKNHLAIVIDEYGGTCGIVTMEDIIEEIFGEIQDEHDSEAPQFIKLDDKTFQVSASVDLDDFQEYFDLQPFEHDADTIAGWITDLAKEIPVKGQTVSYKNLKIKVTEIKQRRINTIKVTKLPKKDKAV